MGAFEQAECECEKYVLTLATGSVTGGDIVNFPSNQTVTWVLEQLRTAGSLSPRCNDIYGHPCFCQLADTPPRDPFSASFRSSCFDIFCLVCVLLGFLNISSLFFCSFLLFWTFLLGGKILLFSGPKLEFLLFWSAFYAEKTVLTAFLRVIRRFFLSVSVLSQTLVVMTQFFTRKHSCGNHVN